MNIQKMMQQAKAMQDKMAEMQEKLGQIEVQGASGGGVVGVTMTCKGEVRALSIDPSVINADEKDVLEDLVKAALNDARSKADQTMADETQKMMEGLGLPAGMQLPF